VIRQQEKKARELAFITMFSIQAGREDVEQALERTLLTEEAIGIHGLISEKVKIWKNNKEAIDNIISGHLKRGNIEDLALVALTALRLGIVEMEYIDDISPKVAINEAVEITKKFGDDNLARFVNGVLDARLRTLRTEGDGYDKREQRNEKTAKHQG
jgi:transcription antitermination protein NusB